MRYRVYRRGLAERSIENTLPWHEKSLHGSADLLHALMQKDCTPVEQCSHAFTL